MMSKIHQMTTFILVTLVVLILAFIALMIFEWGADYSGTNFFNEYTVGEVDGVKIPYEQFNFNVAQTRRNQEQQSGGSMTEVETSKLRNQVWDQTITRILLGKEIDKLNIAVTNEDVSNGVLQFMSQLYGNEPQFQTNGQFDVDKMKAALSNPQLAGQLAEMEQQIEQDIPYQKLQEIVSASLIVTEQEMRAEFMQQNLKAKIEYLMVPVSAFRSQEVTASDAEISKYYSDNKDEFKTQETRKLKYAAFSTAPSVDDSSRFFNILNEIKTQAQDGEDFSRLALRESEDPTVTQNQGDLGFFEQGAMVKPFSDAAFAANPGDIVGPVKSQFGYHIIKVIDKKVEEGKEKVHAAHILKKLEASGGTLDNAYSKAEAFAETAQKDGYNIAADNLGIELKETNDFVYNDAGIIPGVGELSPAMAWTFGKDAGTISEVFSNDQGYYVFLLEAVVPAGYRPLEDVKELCKSRIEIQKRKDLAAEYARKMAPTVQQDSDFRTLAANDPEKILVADTTDYFTRNITVRGIGRAPAVVAKAFSLPLNQVSGMLETDRGYFFIRVTGRDDFDEAAFAAQRTTLRNRIFQRKANNLYREWLQTLKDNAEIEDFRYQFYRS